MDIAGKLNALRLRARVSFVAARRAWIAAGAVVVVVAAGLLTARALIRRANVVATVGFTALTVDDIAQRVKNSPDAYRDYIQSSPRLIVEDQINQLLLYRTALRYRRRYRRKLSALMRQYYQEMLIKEFVDREIVGKIYVPPEDIKNYYNTHLSEFMTPARVRIQEIVLSSQEQAENVLNRLIVGEDFDAIARKESTSESREAGGDLGWIDKEKLDPDLARLVVQMKPGQILAKIVKTTLGYHIIRFGGEEPQRIRSLEEATPYIRNIFVSQQKRKEVETYIGQLRKRSRIDVSERNLEKLKERLQ